LVPGVDNKPPDAITPLGDGWYLVRDDAHTWRVAAAADANGTWLFFDGRTAYVPRDHGSRRRAKGRGDSGVMAPMPATVVSIAAGPGAAVAEGDTVIVLEAMKMELPIKAPRAGVVKAVHCAKGDLVQPGVSLLEIE
jgi:3-methylcrotonyl-CoA carboxylase alpha subunit